jgi:hypothetical protein
MTGLCLARRGGSGRVYSIRQIVKFGETLTIPAGDAAADLPTGNF